MNCKICFEKYDKDLRKPLIALPCGHSLCSVCLLELKKQDSTLCSICRERIQNEKINYDLMDILDLDLMIDPDAKLRKEIKSYFEDVDQLEDKFKLACSQKLQHSELKANSLKEEIERSANKFIDKIQRQKRKLLNEADHLHVSLSNHIEVLSEQATVNLERKYVNQMRKIELNDTKTRLSEVKLGIESNLETINDIQLVYEFKTNQEQLDNLIFGRVSNQNSTINNEASKRYDKEFLLNQRYNKSSKEFPDILVNCEMSVSQNEPSDLESKEETNKPMSYRDVFLGVNSKLTPQNQLDINDTSSSARSSSSLISIQTNEQSQANATKEFKEIKSIDISEFIIDPAKHLKLVIKTLLNKNYVMVYQNKQRVVKYLIFNDDLQVISLNEMYRMHANLQSLILEVHSQKIVSYYMCKDKTYLQVFNTKLYRLHQKKKTQIIRAISLTPTYIYCATSHGLEMFDWNLEFIKSFPFDNMASSIPLYTEFKNEKFYILCANKLVIYNIVTEILQQMGIVEKTIEINAIGMLIDSYNNIFVLSKEKLIHLNEQGILIEETDCKGLPDFSNVLFISNKRDKFLLYDSETFSIKQCK